MPEAAKWWDLRRGEIVLLRSAVGSRVARYASIDTVRAWFHVDELLVEYLLTVDGNLRDAGGQAWMMEVNRHVDTGSRMVDPESFMKRSWGRWVKGTW
jgi:hypothetical protein